MIHILGSRENHPCRARSTKICDNPQHLKDLRARRALVPRLLRLGVALVRVSRHDTREDARVRLDHDPCGVAGVEPRNRDASLEEPPSALEEHLPDRGEVQLLRGQRAGEDVRAPSVLLFASRLRPSILVEDGLELRLAEALDVPDIVLPGRRPANVVDEPPRLTKGEIDTGDPGPGAGERSLEIHERRQSTRGQRPKHIAFQPAVPARDRLCAARAAREIHAIDVHTCPCPVFPSGNRAAPAIYRTPRSPSRLACYRGCVGPAVAMALPSCMWKQQVGLKRSDVAVRLRRSKLCQFGGPSRLAGWLQ